ncbi:hypothetical protein F5Y03DRAFT_381800 [Xylaria venustula]|nr:hypothetical protein F5Y03DRAFT_381800 [Xylaria venustula]
MATDTVSDQILASLNHLSGVNDYKKERPYEIWLDQLPRGLEQTNVRFELHDNIPVTDARSVGFDQFDIELHGFQFLQQEFPVQCRIDGSDSANASDEQRAHILSYIDIMSDFLCQTYGGVKAVAYDWRVRRSRDSPVNKSPLIYTLPDETDARKITIDVAHQVHADGSPNGIKKSLSYLLTPDEQSEVISGKYRLRVVNLWRPLVPVVEVQPLALCDRRSVVDADWEQVEKIQTNWIEESMYLRHNRQHKWYWLSNQTIDEVTSFVVWDSEKADSLSASVPHCSFHVAPPEPSFKQRESIEIRYLLWTQL